VIYRSFLNDNNNNNNNDNDNNNISHGGWFMNKSNFIAPPRVGYKTAAAVAAFTKIKCF